MPVRSSDGFSFWENHNLVNVVHLINLCDKARSFENQNHLFSWRRDSAHFSKVTATKTPAP